MTKKAKHERDVLFLKLLVKSSSEVTDEEVVYFRDHPDQIDKIAAPVSIHKMFLWTGALLGVVFVGVAKLLHHSGMLDQLSEGFREFVVDIVFESGVALIGAAITAYILGVLLNKQQENAHRWRAEIRRRIDEYQSPH